MCKNTYRVWTEVAVPRYYWVEAESADDAERRFNRGLWEYGGEDWDCARETGIEGIDLLKEGEDDQAQ